MVGTYNTEIWAYFSQIGLPLWYPIRARTLSEDAGFWAQFRMYVHALCHLLPISTCDRVSLRNLWWNLSILRLFMRMGEGGVGTQPGSALAASKVVFHCSRARGLQIVR